MKVKILSLLVASVLSISSLMAYNTVPVCFHDLETHFFDNVAVSQALSLHIIDPGVWTPIVNDLNYYSHEVPKLVEEEAKKMNPNPLNRPFDPVKAEELLMQVLYNIFSNTLIKYQITNPGDIREMFEFIRDSNQKRIDACRGYKKI